ncbi:MAG: signal peptidase I [Porphyromonadaceae bacterium]|nr:MAG: signal peptidase I [Porphyromonadaceae bacterium]
MVIYRCLKDLRQAIKYCFIIIISLILIYGILKIFFTTYVVYQNSMSPSIKKGDKILVLSSIRITSKNGSRIYKPFKIKRGQIYIINPNFESYLCIKRCVGIGNDSIYYNSKNLKVIQGDRIQYNFELLTNDYLDSSSHFIEPFKREYVKQGCVFFIGDNYNHSKDSRNYVLIPSNQIKGKYLFTLRKGSI